MNKRILVGIALLIIAGIIIGVYFLTNDNSNSAVTEDSLRFKEENEALNSELNEDGTNRYTPLSIREDNNIVYLTYEGLLDLYNNKTGILYIGRAASPWCRLLIPFMLDFAEEENVNIYYFDIEDDKAENTEEYKNILSMFDEFLQTDTITQNEDDPDFDPDLKRVVLPHLFFIQNGEIEADLPMFQHEYLRDNESDKVKQLLREKHNATASYFGNTAISDDGDCEC